MRFRLKKKNSFYLAWRLATAKSFFLDLLLVIVTCWISKSVSKSLLVDSLRLNERSPRCLGSKYRISNLIHSQILQIPLQDFEFPFHIEHLNWYILNERVMQIHVQFDIHYTKFQISQILPF